MKEVRKYLETGQVNAEREASDLNSFIQQTIIDRDNVQNKLSEYQFATKSVTQRYPLNLLQKEQARLETELEALNSSLKDADQKLTKQNELVQQFQKAIRAIKGL